MLGFSKYVNQRRGRKCLYLQLLDLLETWLDNMQNCLDVTLSAALGANKRFISWIRVWFYFHCIIDHRNLIRRQIEWLMDMGFWLVKYCMCRVLVWLCFVWTVGGIAEREAGFWWCIQLQRRNGSGVCSQKVLFSVCPLRKWFSEVGLVVKVWTGFASFLSSSKLSSFFLGKSKLSSC